MICELLNWLACGLTILGTWETARKTPNLFRLNLCYMMSCILLIYCMSISQNWAMVSMYIVLLIFSLRGIYLNIFKWKKGTIFCPFSAICKNYKFNTCEVRVGIHKFKEQFLWYWKQQTKGCYQVKPKPKVIEIDWPTDEEQKTLLAQGGIVKEKINTVLNQKKV